jgi:hypothetical protein
MILALATTLSAAALAQTWNSSYRAGLHAAQNGEWATARDDFQFAAQLKPGDIAKSTPDPEGSHTLWRNGALYSPSFLAAYCGLKEAFILTGQHRSYLLNKVTREFEDLIARGQYSVETFFFLDQAYMMLGDTSKRMSLADEVTDVGPAMTWKVDASGIEPDDEALLAQLPHPAKAAVPHVHGPAVTKSISFNAAPMEAQTPATGSVPVQKSKFVPEISNTTVQGMAAGPTAPATDSLPATVTDNDDSQLAVPEVSAPTQAPTPRMTPSEHAQAEVTQSPVSSPAPTSTTLTTPYAPVYVPSVTKSTTAENHDTKVTRKHHGRRDRDVTPATETPLAYNTVEPVTVKTIEHPATVKVRATSTLVPSMPTKYALIIGNSESKMDGGAMPYAGDDAQLLRRSLVDNAGYVDQNIELVINATSDQIAATVNALASRVGDKGIVFLYFSGVGANIDGKDYLAGVDSDVTNDTSTMIAKDDVYKAFMLKGARIYAFFQCNRPITDGHFFGSEIPLVGSISQMQATLPGQTVNSINTDGKVVGLFTNSFVNTLKDIRSNQTPILDFGWQLFYNLRRGDTGQEGGSSNQSPSLPVLTNMASDARF